MMRTLPEKSVQTELNDWIEMFEGIKGCQLSRLKENKILIASFAPVLWAGGGETYYSESEYQIGCLKPMESCLAICMDFPKDTLRIWDVQGLIDPDDSLEYVFPSEKSPDKRSWWRFCTGESFNSIHLVLYADQFGNYDINRKELKDLISYIVRVSYG